MTSEDMQRELERQPSVPLRLHLSSGKVVEVLCAGTAWVRQNTLALVDPLAPHSAAIGGYDVLAMRLIERIEPAAEPTAT